MKDNLCAYYTNSDDITSYMVHKIDLNEGDYLLEPSAGEGIFIDKVLETKKSIKIDAVDISPKAIQILMNKYKNNKQVFVKETDTLIDDKFDYYANIGGTYDKVIGNPPYGAWQDYDKRELLKKKYPGQYVKETYSLFLLRVISLLKEGGKLSFIIPDTFLFLNMHSKLREFLLKDTKIEEILIFPSKFFPGVSFGYSNLSIISLKKEKNGSLDNSIRIIRGFKKPNELNLVINNKLENLEVLYLKQSDILNNPQYRFVLTKKNIGLFNHTNINSKKLGDVADIVTGFYTGDNKRFIKVKDYDVKGSKGYDLINNELIYNCNDLSGIAIDGEGYVPYIKTSPVWKYKESKDEWFVRWDKSTIAFYNCNKKSRFQNSLFYFKTGVGIPMVKSSVIRAFLMKDRVFDQAIVGIFPKDISKLYYILALMNSKTINEIVHLINPTANNSSNYIKLIPYIEPNGDTISIISNYVDRILKEQNIDIINDIQKKIDSLIDDIYTCVK